MAKNGSMIRVARQRGADVWKFVWRKPDGTRGAKIIGTVKQYKAESQAYADPFVQTKLIEMNTGSIDLPDVAGTIRQIAQEYKKNRLPEKSYKQQQSEECFLNNYILPKWGDSSASELVSVDIYRWLTKLKRMDGEDASGKLRGGVRSTLALMIDYAKLEGLFPASVPNPVRSAAKGGGMEFRLEGTATRKRGTPDVLEFNEFLMVWDEIKLEPFRTIWLMTGCLGCRISEIIGLKWQDLAFGPKGTITLTQGFVSGRETKLKNVASRQSVPFHPDLQKEITKWRESGDCFYKEPENWVFASPYTRGRNPYWPDSMADNHIHPAVERLVKADKMPEKKVRHHTLRHSHKFWLEELGTSAAVMQRALRHADYRTTQKYGEGKDFVPDTLRNANAKLVEMRKRTAV